MANDEQAAHDETPTQLRGSTTSEEATKPGELPTDALASLQHMESLLGQIRGSLDASARAGEHREYSFWRLLGAVFQVIVGGLVALALLDWLLQAPSDSLLIKLALAAVLQLSALTAFVVSRDRS